MPTYDYRCDACGHTFDEMQKFSDAPLTKCPECKKNKLERLFGGGGAIIFKGGGFYETDYRRAGQKSDAGESGGGEAKETKSETPAADSAPKAEAKTETKSESKSSAKKKDK